MGNFDYNFVFRYRFVSISISYVKYLLHTLQKKGYDKAGADDMVLDLSTSEVSFLLFCFDFWILQEKFKMRARANGTFLLVPVNRAL